MNVPSVAAITTSFWRLRGPVGLILSACLASAVPPSPDRDDSGQPAKRSFPWRRPWTEAWRNSLRLVWGVVEGDRPQHHRRWVGRQMEGGRRLGRTSLAGRRRGSSCIQSAVDGPRLCCIGGDGSRAIALLLGPGDGERLHQRQLQVPVHVPRRRRRSAQGLKPASSACRAAMSANPVRHAHQE